MRSTNRKRLLLVSGSVILLCLTIIVGMTFALFTDEERVSNHLKAGDLDITLERVSLASTYMTERGFLDTKTVIDNPPKDFTNNNVDNVFALDGAVIVPQSSYTAKMRITNNNDATDANGDGEPDAVGFSNVAYGYWIEIEYRGKDNVDLAKQVKVTVTKPDGSSTSEYVGEGLVVGGEGNFVGILGAGDSEEFFVTVTFVDDRTLKQGEEIFDNNDAKGQDITFDLVVHAVQYTGKDPNLNSNP